MSYINLNGRLIKADEAGIGPGNRAYRYGYGLFETMLAIDGRIHLEQLHWERLWEGMHTLQIPADKFFRQKLESALKQTVQRTVPEGRCRIRLQVYAGDGGFYDGDYKAGFSIEAFPLEAEKAGLNENGLVLGIATTIKQSSHFSHIKTCAALPYALAAREARASQWNDALLCNERGRVAETTIANLFWVAGNIIYTPPLSEGCVAGVMRRHILEAGVAAGFNMAERPCERGDLEQAAGVFITNAIYGIRWVQQIINHSYKQSLATELHRQLIHDL